MKKKNNFKFLGAILFIFMIMFWSVLLYFVSPSKIIEKIGITNGYILVFISGLLGGTSLFLPFPYYIFVFTFGAAKLNPILLGVATGIGVTLGESTSYLLGYTGREILPKHWDKHIGKFYNWCIKRPKWMIPIIFFLYGCFVPLPNDFLTIPMGIARYPYVKSIIPLGLGNIVFSIILAYSGLYGWNLLFKL